ncbi:MAG TPA: hypothetical protein VGR45_06715 [Stellaceae bacterium]|nr:hypothetical protein [Stellaceae bacterium]
MSDAAALRAVYGPHAAKKIATRFGVAVVTAKTWLSGGIPPARRRQMARELLAEMDRQDAERAEIRRRLQGETGGMGGFDRAVVGAADALAHAAGALAKRAAR